MFNFIKETLKKVYSAFTSRIGSLFAQETIDKETLTQLETILIESDMGVGMTREILAQLESGVANGTLQKGADLKEALSKYLWAALKESKHNEPVSIFLMVGVNGTGKTTCTAKLAKLYKDQGKKVLVVAADTFRAAAVAQLAVWAERVGVDLEQGKEGQDPASVVFAGCQRFKEQKYDILIIDTAGRLQTKISLMNELEKIKRVVARTLQGYDVCTLLTVDAMLGQNSLAQAKVFHEATTLNGIIMTKMDGTGKGGILFAIVKELSVPILYLSYGEDLADLKPFNPQEFVANLLSS